jgi:hypothetical protein
MKIYNKYILTVTVLLLLTTVILVALGIDSLDVYYISYVTEALIVTELYRHLLPRTRRGLNTVSVILLAGFLIIVVLETIRILGE